MPQSSAIDSLPGPVLGRYRPIRPLGSGGSGSVWLAVDEVTGLEVALKIVRREGKAADRAEREAAAAARLRHERCLRAYALAHDSGHVYIAYEYVPGRTLREALNAAELDDAGAVEAAVQILEGLAHAHARGIVHRDVKPANVLLAAGDGVSVRLLDFGLALIEEAETLTAVGDVPGTLAYIAPERFGGPPATPASDVWAVGVILWEALAGRHPFWKPSVLESVRAIEAGAPPLASVRPDLPRPLVAAVDGALDLDPARRPGAARLADALRGAARTRKRGRSDGAALRPTRAHVERSAPAALAALAAGWTAATLPFYPSGWPFVLAALAGAAMLVRPVVGLAVALAVPMLPLGNHSLGLAVVYAALAAVLLALFAREPRGGPLAVLGPLLAPLGALGLVPLAVRSLGSPVRRAAAAGTAVLLAAVVAGLRGAPLPLTGEPPPADLGIAASERPLAVAEALWDALAAHPSLALAAAAVALGAALLPLALARGPWGVAVWGAGLIAATLLPAPEVRAAPIVVAVWITCAILACAPALSVTARAGDTPGP